MCSESRSQSWRESSGTELERLELVLSTNICKVIRVCTRTTAFQSPHRLPAALTVEVVAAELTLQHVTSQPLLAQAVLALLALGLPLLDVCGAVVTDHLQLPAFSRLATDTRDSDKVSSPWAGRRAKIGPGRLLRGKFK